MNQPRLALGLATGSFALSFAAWGLVGGLAPIFAELYHLNASQTALLVAVPVLLGSLARLPMGMLTDRFGGRLVFTLLLVASSAAAFAVPYTSSYGQMIGAGFVHVTVVGALITLMVTVCVTTLKLIRSAGVNTTVNTWPVPTFRTVLAAGWYAYVPATFALAFNCEALSRVP